MYDSAVLMSMYNSSTDVYIRESTHESTGVIVAHSLGVAERL